MATEIVVPTLGESVTEATVAQWFKKVGDAVKLDEPVVELETDKVTLEVGAPAAGVISDIKADEGTDVEVGAVLGAVDETAEGAVDSDDGGADKANGAATDGVAEESGAAQPAAAAPAEEKSEPAAASASSGGAGMATATDDSGELSPAVRKLVEEHSVDPEKIDGSGKDGRVTKGDVLAYVDGGGAKKEAPAKKAPSKPREAGAREERVRMSRLRQRIAERLKEAQNTAAILTTFNEIDMTNVMAFRSAHKDQFEKTHEIKLGFMSFFVKACVQALKEIPTVNAEIEGDEIIYKNRYDIGVAVGTGQGLVVPVVRDCDTRSFAEIEREITDLGRRAQDGSLTIDDLTGGTFSITNGGIFGNLLSTPILNPPQSGILGMHKIQDRPMAIDGEVVIRPMMYIALSYDHRIIDGREAVTFLRRVKECVEEPERMLLLV